MGPSQLPVRLKDQGSISGEAGADEGAQPFNDPDGSLSASDEAERPRLFLVRLEHGMLFWGRLSTDVLSRG